MCCRERERPDQSSLPDSESTPPLRKGVRRYRPPLVGCMRMGSMLTRRASTKATRHHPQLVSRETAIMGNRCEQCRAPSSTVHGRRIEGAIAPAFVSPSWKWQSPTDNRSGHEKVVTPRRAPPLPHGEVKELASRFHVKPRGYLHSSPSTSESTCRCNQQRIRS